MRHQKQSAWYIAGLAILFSCGGGRPAPQERAARRPAPRAARPPPGAERYTWVAQISSPLSPENDDPTVTPLARACPERDAALDRVARRLAQRFAKGLPDLEAPELVFALRAEGSPYVWPRAWALEGARAGDAVTRDRFERFLGSFDEHGVRRCGLAYHEERGHRAVAALALDALADLDPMPTRARAGTWIDVRARVLVEASNPEVVVLAPNRPPRTLVSSLGGGLVRARFAADRPGAWLVQILISTQSGPRPVLEAVVYVDEEPPNAFLAEPAPGEEQAADHLSAKESIEQIVAAVRRHAGLRALRREARLDELAQAHADAMRDAARLAHDVGTGDPRIRLEEAGLSVAAAGENVAHAASVQRAHRALWASPSHRGNLLHPRFDAIGIGVASSPDETLWVCQLFADFR